MRVVTFGEIMLRLTPPGFEQTVQADTFSACYGGAEANVALSLACLGADASFVSRVPAHAIGQAAVNALRHWGVDTRYMVRGGDRLGLYYLERGAAQRPSKVIYDRAHSALSEACDTDFDWEKILTGADYFHLTGITPALGEHLPDICLHACRTAHALGVKVSFDPNYRAKLWSISRASEVMTSLLREVDLLITNENQAAELFGITVDPREINGDEVSEAGYLGLSRTLADTYGLETVALTERRTFSANDNSFCAKLYTEGQMYTARKYRMDIVDRVGAGDAFAAGLLFAMGQQLPPVDAINFATAAGVLKHSIPGDTSPLTEAEVAALASGNASGRVQR